jgi:hypothetical protein
MVVVLALSVVLVLTDALDVLEWLDKTLLILFLDVFTSTALLDLALVTVL